MGMINSMMKVNIYHREKEFRAFSAFVEVLKNNNKLTEFVNSRGRF